MYLFAHDLSQEFETMMFREIDQLYISFHKLILLCRNNVKYCYLIIIIMTLGMEDHGLLSSAYVEESQVYFRCNSRVEVKLLRDSQGGSNKANCYLYKQKVEIFLKLTLKLLGC